MTKFRTASWNRLTGASLSVHPHSQSHVYYTRGDGDRGSSIERTEVDPCARIHLERPPGERLRRPRQFAIRLKVARKLSPAWSENTSVSRIFPCPRSYAKQDHYGSTNNITCCLNWIIGKFQCNLHSLVTKSFKKHVGRDLPCIFQYQVKDIILVLIWKAS